MPRLSIIRFRRREEGTIAVLWAGALIMVLGFAAVAFDLGRVVNTQAELQSFADAVALAAAGELDGKTDAIIRANAAAQNLVSGHQTFAGGSQVLSGSADYTVTYLSAIRADDNNPSQTDTVTTDATKAAFAKVNVTPRSLSLGFLRAVTAMTGGSNAAITPSITAEAVAGFTQEACDITPLMVCIPSGYKADSNIGKMILLHAGGQGAAWGPGDFGFLRLDKADLGASCGNLNGAQRTRCLLAAEQGVSVCYRKRGVDTEPGQKTGIEDVAFNTRFDIFNGSMSNDKNDVRYRPAPNVIKGLKANGGGNGNGNGNSCIGNNADVTTDTATLPRDTNVTTSVRFGNGNFSLGTYLDKNYGNGNGTYEAGEGAELFASTITQAIDPTYRSATAGSGSTPPGNMTRYELYLREIALGNSRTTGPNADKILLARTETGRPLCSNQISPNAWRRTLIIAGVDCTANPIQGQTDNVPVEEYIKVFMTEPVKSSGNDRYIYGEVLGTAGKAGYTSAGEGGIFRDVVQLYR